MVKDAVKELSHGGFYEIEIVLKLNLIILFQTRNAFRTPRRTYEVNS